MSRRAAGFTLLELLVALALFAVLSALAYGGLQSVLRAKAQSATHSEQLEALQSAYLLLGRDLEQAAPRPVRDAYGDVRPALEGGPDGETLVELTHDGWPNPGQWQRSHLQRVAYAVRDGRLLRLSWAVLDRAQDSLPVEQQLLEGVGDARVRFLDGSREWQPSWPPAAAPVTDVSALPQAVELSLEVEGWGRIVRVFRIPSGGGIKESGGGES
jgi:general secretion pathway protein J